MNPGYTDSLTQYFHLHSALGQVSTQFSISFSFLLISNSQFINSNSPKLFPNQSNFQTRKTLDHFADMAGQSDPHISLFSAEEVPFPSLIILYTSSCRNSPVILPFFVYLFGYIRWNLWLKMN